MKNYKALVMILILSMLMSSMAFGEGTTVDQITDIEDVEWVEPFVKKVLDSDVMPAYSDNTFKPAQYATKMEVINVIYRMALLKGEVTTDAADQLVTKYKSTIEAYLIPNNLEPYGPDNHRAVAYALENTIIKKSELSLFFVNGKFEVISKVDASVFLSKAMNVYLGENVNKFYEIQYKDGGEINLLQWPWINLLIEKEIVVAGSDKNFNPNSILNRSILAVMSSNVIREIEGFVPNESTTPVENNTTTVASGKISILHYDKNIIEIRDANNKLNVYDATEGNLKINGETVAIQNLEPGMSVKIEVSGKKLITLEVLEDYTSVKGTIGSVGVKVTVKGETYRVISIEKDGAYKYYKSLNSVVVEKDYQTSTLDELVDGDLVEVFYQGDYAKKVVALSNKPILTGSLQRSTQFNKGDAISVKLSNGKLYEQTLTNEVTKFNISSDLSKGDIVKMTIEKGMIIAVEATGLSSEASGRVTRITISSTPSISIMDKKGTTRTFNIAANAVVKNLGTIDTNGLYGLRLDQDVTLELSGVEANLILINQSVEKGQFQAEITEIHKNINLIKALDTNNKAWIISLEGSDQNIGDYTVGDTVFVYGVEVSGDLFEADLIIVLE